MDIIYKLQSLKGRTPPVDFISILDKTQGTMVEIKQKITSEKLLKRDQFSLLKEDSVVTGLIEIVPKNLPKAPKQLNYVFRR